MPIRTYLRQVVGKVSACFQNVYVTKAKIHRVLPRRKRIVAKVLTSTIAN